MIPTGYASRKGLCLGGGRCETQLILQYEEPSGCLGVLVSLYTLLAAARLY